MKLNNGNRIKQPSSYNQSKDKVCPYLMPWEQLSENSKERWIKDYANE